MVKIPCSLTCWVSSVYQTLPAYISSLEETAGHKVAASSKREKKNHLLFHLVVITISWCSFASLEMRSIPHYFHKVYLRLVI